MSEKVKGEDEGEDGREDGRGKMGRQDDTGNVPACGHFAGRLADGDNCKRL